MSIKSIGHVGFTVSDMEKALDFYVNKLGFQVVTRINAPGREIVFVQICPGQTIELFSGGKQSSPKGSDVIGFAHTCLIVEDIQNLLAELAEKGVAVPKEVAISPTGGARCVIYDPDGNGIELSQRGSDAKF